MTSIPGPLLDHLESRLDDSFADAKSVAGGSINQAAYIESANIGPCFLKWNRSDDPDMFVKEVKGLQMLGDADTELIVPEVIDHGTLEDASMGYLLMDYIEKGSAATDSAHHFGRNLARLHEHTDDQHGLDHDNYIGRLPQSNRRHENWVDFFINERIDAQLKRALDQGALPGSIKSNFQRMYRQLPDLLPEEPPSLLHGDLWGGNYMYNSDGIAAIFDPAAYYGSREMELAFTHMFGGFSPDFYEGYNQKWPLEPGFDERIQIYNLYHLMTHTNMFGGHYGRRVQQIVKQF